MDTFKNPDVWKQNLAYQIGDFVLYNGTVYVAIKPVPAGTEMSADYWTDFNGGGGGSSDFTTAHVTIVNTLEYPVGGKMAMAASEEGNYYSDGSPYVPEGGTSTFSAILYRGHCLALFDGGRTQTIDGSATAIADGVVDIYGDCSITIS